MTRFARAKGSKASNERREEEPTPWHVMRQQLADQLNNTVPPSCENETYNLKNLLKNENDVKEEVWSEFDDLKGNDKQYPLESEILKIKSEPCIEEEHKKKTSDSFASDGNDKIINDVTEKRQLKTNKKRKNIQESLKNEECEKTVIGLKGSSTSDVPKKRKITKEKKQVHESSKKLVKLDSSLLKKRNTNIDSLDCGKSGKVKGLMPFKQVEEENNIILKSKKPFKESNTESLNSHSIEKKTNHYFQNRIHQDRNFHTIIANGREIKVVQYEGFLIKQDDAIELKKLRRKLRKQNIPNEKIKAIMKLERRKAEKALAREKTNVCFHCRKFGHKLSDCPDSKDTELSQSGICFKCGSTEHTHFECKVSQSQGFRYAVCFVCKEQGHIARQCPLNPQGQYPKGGCCHLCGEVTHLRKDCPKAVEDNSSNSSKVITVEKLMNNNLEDISVQSFNSHKSKIKRSKVVEF